MSVMSRKLHCTDVARATRPIAWVSRPTFDDLMMVLARDFELRVEPVERSFTAQELEARLRDCDVAIIGTKDHVGAAEILHADRLRVVACMSVGYDNVDVDALTRAGILVTNAGDIANDTVADFAWLLILAASRRLVAADYWIRTCKWQSPARYLDWLGVGIRARTLGILGMGRIGRAVAMRAGAFKMDVIYHNRHRCSTAVEQRCRAAYAEKDELLRRADVIVLTVPLTDATRHAVGAPELAMMKPTAILVNIARGGVVDDHALAVALARHEIAAAGLDVFEREPSIDPALLLLDNVVLCPHIACATIDARHAMVGAAVENARAVFGFGIHAGAPPNLVNPSALA